MEDFYKMKPMDGIGENRFHTRFTNLVACFFRFKGGQRTDADKVVLELCLRINDEASTTKGVTVPPLVSVKQVLQ